MNPEKLDKNFPRYTDFDPLVPVWCVTPDLDGCIHRFFDAPPVSPSGKLIAYFQLPTEERQPKICESGMVYARCLETGAIVYRRKSAAWEPQMGANINWGASDEELFFNDMDFDNMTPFAWRVNPFKWRERAMEGTVYHASPDGRRLISTDLTTMRKTQPGYGALAAKSKVRRNIGLVKDDGFYITNTRTGKCRLFASIHDLVTKSNPPVNIDDPDKYEIYGFHSKFNPQGDRVMMSLRWFPRTGKPRWDMFTEDFQSVKYAWVTSDIEGGSLACAVGPEQWEKGGHHATWFPDGRRISMNLNIDGDGMRFVQVNADGSGLRKIIDGVVGSGHPTVHPDGRHILTDAYTWEKLAFGDGTVPLRWIDIETGEEKTVVRINTQTTSDDKVMRVDPHPAWDRSWRYVTFNAFFSGTRRVFIADMSPLLDAPWSGGN